MSKILKTVVFEVSSGNSGEGVFVETDIVDNGDRDKGLKIGVFLNQRIVLNSYGNSAQLNLYSSCFTPENLRELADGLESEIVKAQNS